MVSYDRDLVHLGSQHKLLPNDHMAFLGIIWIHFGLGQLFLFETLGVVSYDSDMVHLGSQLKFLADD